MDVGSSSTHSPTEYRISSEEMALLRSFLCEYQVEPEYRIAIHLAVLAGKLARVDIHKEWPHLIPSLLKTIQTDGDPHCLRSVRALTTLQQVVQELSAINSACGKKLYGQICLQLFSDVAKVWAVQLKFLQSYISSCKLDQGTATLVGAVNNAVELQDFHVECTIVTCMLTTTVLNRVLERAFEELVAKSSDKFEKFLKTYIGAMQMLCKFIRSVRPLCQSLLNAYQSNEKGCLKSSCSSPFAHLKRLFDVENCEDDSADLDENYYIPDRFLLYLASMRSPSLLVFRCTNLVLRLLKRLSGLPVLLQKKYPLAVAPHLTPLLLYYYHQLIEEHTASIRPVVDNDAPVSVESAAVLGMNEAEVRAYRMCLSSPVLSLKCIILSATLFISNVLACNCYDAYNLVRRISAVTDPNEEGEVDGGNGLYMEEEAETNPTLTAAHHSRNNFFSSERVSTIINCMLDTTLRLTPQDLELWASDPEEFVHAEDAIATGDHYHGVTSLKLASHQLLCNLAESYAELVGDMFLALLSDHARQLRAISVFISSSTDPLVAKVMQNEILLWDAIYTCVGLVNKTVAARIPSACSWLGSSLGPLLSQVIKSSAAGAINGAQVLRGKMVWMLGRWLGIFHPRFRHCGLDFLVRVISNSDPQTASGVVVKINAVKALHSLINLPDYELSELMPVLLQLIDSLCTLVHQCQDSECKALVLEEIGDLLMLLGTEICQTLVRPIAEYLSRLWEQTAANDPVRSAIVEVCCLSCTTLLLFMLFMLFMLLQIDSS